MKKALLVLVLSAGVSGCAFTTENIDLSYAPQPGVAKIAEANNVIVSVQVDDQRQDKSNRVSSKKNGFGMETAPILANEDVTVTVRRAIEQELQSRGFSIGNGSVVTILAELTRFWNDHKVGFFSIDAIAELNMNVLVKDKSGTILYSRTIQAQGIEPNNQLSNGNNARLALNKALEKGMKLLFEDGTFISALIHDARKSPPAAGQ